MNNKHLTLIQRNTIEFYLNNNSKLVSIAGAISKSDRTISLEIKRNRYLYVRKNLKNKCGNQLSCSITRLCDVCLAGKCKFCSHFTCNDLCDLFTEFPTCKRLSKFPFVCNACSNLENCKLPKFFYKASNAHDQYKENISNHKCGARADNIELAIINDALKDGLAKNHSLAVIKNNYNLNKSLSTLYRYVDLGYLDVKNIDLKKQVSYKQRYKKTISKPINYDYLQGRTYDFYIEYMANNPLAHVWQLDTIEGKKGSNEKAVMSLLSTKCDLQLYFLLDSVTQSNVIKIFDSIKNQLGSDLFKDTFEVLLTDNGKEFRDPLSIVSDNENGEILCELFYCDPRRSDQKAKCEKNHVHFREIIKKGESMNELTFPKLCNVSNNVNNYPRKSLTFKSPFDVASVFMNDKVLKLNRLHYIPPIDVVLKKQK